MDCKLRFCVEGGSGRASCRNGHWSRALEEEGQALQVQVHLERMAGGTQRYEHSNYGTKGMRGSSETSACPSSGPSPPPARHSVRQAGGEAAHAWAALHCRRDDAKMKNAAPSSPCFLALQPVPAVTNGLQPPRGLFSGLGCGALVAFGGDLCPASLDSS